MELTEAQKEFSLLLPQHLRGGLVWGVAPTGHGSFLAASRDTFGPLQSLTQHAMVEAVLSVASKTLGFTSVLCCPDLDTTILGSSGKTYLLSGPFSGAGSSQGTVVHGTLLNFPTGGRHEVVSYSSFKWDLNPKSLLILVSIVQNHTNDKMCRASAH